MTTDRLPAPYAPTSTVGDLGNTAFLPMLYAPAPNYNPYAAERVGVLGRISRSHPLWWISPISSLLAAGTEAVVHASHAAAGAFTLFGASALCMIGTVARSVRSASAHINVGKSATFTGDVNVEAQGGGGPAVAAAVSFSICGVGTLVGGTLVLLTGVVVAVGGVVYLIPAWLTAHHAEQDHRRHLEAAAMDHMYEYRDKQLDTAARIAESGRFNGVALNFDREYDRVTAHLRELEVRLNGVGVTPQVQAFMDQQAQIATAPARREIAPEAAPADYADDWMGLANGLKDSAGHRHT